MNTNTLISTTKLKLVNNVMLKVLSYVPNKQIKSITHQSSSEKILNKRLISYLFKHRVKPDYLFLELSFNEVKLHKLKKDENKTTLFNQSNKKTIPITNGLGIYNKELNTFYIKENNKLDSYTIKNGSFVKTKTIDFKNNTNFKDIGQFLCVLDKHYIICSIGSFTNFIIDLKQEKLISTSLSYGDIWQVNNKYAFHVDNNNDYYFRIGLNENKDNLEAIEFKTLSNIGLQNLHMICIKDNYLVYENEEENILKMCNIENEKTEKLYDEAIELKYGLTINKNNETIVLLYGNEETTVFDFNNRKVLKKYDFTVESVFYLEDYEEMVLRVDGYYHVINLDEITTIKEFLPKKEDSKSNEITGRFYLVDKF